MDKKLIIPDFQSIKVNLLTNKDVDYFLDISIYRFRFIHKSDNSIQGSLEIIDGPVMYVSLVYNVVTLGEFGEAYRKVRTDLVEFYKNHINSLYEGE